MPSNPARKRTHKQAYFMHKADAVYSSNGAMSCEDVRIPHQWCLDPSSALDLTDADFVCVVCGARGQMETNTPRFASVR